MAGLVPVKLGQGLETMPTRDSGYFSDEPSGTDKLSRQAFADAVADIITSTHTPFSIALNGGWGTGKTTILRMIEQALRERETECEEATGASEFVRKFPVIWNSAWANADATEPHLSILYDIYSVLEELKPNKTPGTANEAMEQVFKEYAAPASKVVATVLKKYTDIDLQNIRSTYATQQIEQLKGIRGLSSAVTASIEEVLGCGGADSRLVIFIDDIDRCDADYAVKLLDALLLTFNIPRCVFVVPMDRPVIAAHLEAVKSRSAGSDVSFSSIKYLDKLFQIQLSLPKIRRQVATDFFKTHLKLDDNCLDDDVLEDADFNPRYAKRLVNRFNFYAELLDDNLDISERPRRRFSLFILICLEEKYQDFIDYLRANPHELAKIYADVEASGPNEDERPADAIASFSDRAEDLVSAEYQKFTVGRGNEGIRRLVTVLSKRGDYEFVREFLTGERALTSGTIRRKTVSHDVVSLRLQQHALYIDTSGLRGWRGSLSYLTLNGFNFTQLPKIQQMDFQGANLSGAVFHEVDCSFSKFDGCDLTGAQFVGANLTGCSFEQAKVKGADFAGANLENSNFRGAKMIDSASWDSANVDAALFLDLDKTRN